MTILTSPVRRIEGLTLDDYLASPEAYLGARAEQADVLNPLPSGQRIGEIDLATGPDTATETNRLVEGLPPSPRAARPLSPMLSPEEATERGGSVGLSFPQPTRAEVVDIMVRRKKAELARQAVMRRSPGGIGLESAALAVDLLVTATDPLNIASAFLPVVREARFAQWARTLGPTAARFARGTVEGAVGAAVVEPVVLSAATQEQADYDMMDSLLNVAFGTALGGGLHVAGGAAADALARRLGGQTLSERLSAAPLEIRESALRTAVAQAIEGRQINVEPLLGGSRFLDTTSLSTRTETFVPREGAVSREAAPGRVPEERRAEPPATLVPLEAGRGTRGVFATEEAARRAAARQGDDVRVVARRDAEGFTLARASRAEPLREPGGQVREFRNKRQAERFIAQLAPDQRRGLAAAPVGPAGQRRHVVLRDATPDEIRAIAARPGDVRFAEVTRPRVTRQEPTALLARSQEPTLQQQIDAAVQHGRDPRQIALADFRAAEHAEEIIKQIPVDETADTAQQFLDDALEQVDELRRAVDIPDEEFKSMLAILDDQIAEAEALGRAARAAALCDLRR